MSQDTIQSEPVSKLFKGRNFGFLATLMPDGSPQVTPTWIDIDGDYIIVNTAIGRLKDKNVSRDPRVAVSVADQTNPNNMVTVKGRL
jgi:PPOX class probable F420-dependent enzyme